MGGRSTEFSLDIGAHKNPRFSASLTDIERALRPKPKLSLEEITERLPEYYRRFAQAFNPEEAAKLPRYRLGFNHEIVLEKNADGKDKEVP
jgi:hypothetical protein